MKDIIPGVDIVTTGETQQLDNKTLVSPVLKGTVNVGEGLTIPYFKGNAVFNSNVNVTGSFGAGVANFSGVVGFAGVTKLAATMNAAAQSITNVNMVRFSVSTDSAAIADEVAISGFDTTAGHRTLSISCEEVVTSNTNYLTMSHKLPVRINGTTYNFMLIA